MTSDDQYFLDSLSIISRDVQRYTQECAHAVDNVFDDLASLLRKHLERAASWWPQILRPPFMPNVRLRSWRATDADLSVGFLTRLRHVFLGNHPLILTSIALTGFFWYLVQKRRRSHRRRGRAKRRLNGARKEVVILLGSLETPESRCVIVDLERRGYIVYVVTYSEKDDQGVRAEGKVDILPLRFKPGDPSGRPASVERLYRVLRPREFCPPSLAVDDMSLSGIIVIPDTSYPTGTISAMRMESWSDIIQARVLVPLDSIQVLMPLVVDFRSKILLLTPTTNSSLAMPLHAAENTVVGALEGYADTLRNELRLIGVGVHHVKMGAFDFGKYITSDTRVIEQGRGRRRSTPPKELNWAVFDILAGKQRNSVVRTGRDSLLYHVAGRLIPHKFVAWMAGLRGRSVSRDSHKRNVEHAGQTALV